MLKKHKKTLQLAARKKQTTFTKQKIQIFTLILLVLSVAAAQFSGLYPYVYSYALCKDKPLEIIGNYYRVPFDKEYGVHPGSDYSRCYDGQLPKDLRRDPSAIPEMKKAALQDEERARIAKISDYTVYKPDGYTILSYSQSDNGDRFESNFRVKTVSGTEFYVSEMKKGASYDYASICYRPSSENWSGKIIGRDSKGREMCRTNFSKYVTKYIVGIYIDETAIIMRTNNNDEAILNTEASDIFSSMKPDRDI